MKKRALTILCAALFCLSFQSSQTRAENPRGVTATPKPDLRITNVLCCFHDRVRFTILSSGYSVPANTISVQVWIKEKGSQAMFYDYMHEAVIQEPIPADTPTLLTILLPQDKLLTTGRTFNLYIDSGNKIDESEEGNNVSQTFNGATPEMDLKLKDEIYFHLGQPDSQAGGPGKPLKVKKSQLTTCRTGMCARITARILKDPAKFKVGVAVKYRNITTGFEDDGTFETDAGQATKDILVDIPLQDGENLVRFELDWKDRFYEFDEKNNVLEVPVTLIVINNGGRD